MYGVEYSAVIGWKTRTFVWTRFSNARYGYLFANHRRVLYFTPPDPHPVHQSRGNTVQRCDWSKDAFVYMCPVWMSRLCVILSQSQRCISPGTSNNGISPSKPTVQMTVCQWFTPPMILRLTLAPAPDTTRW